MTSRNTRVGLAALAVLLSCCGCAAGPGGGTGGRNWLGYLCYGSDDTPEEKEANRKALESLRSTPAPTGTASAPTEPSAKPPGNPIEGDATPSGNAFLPLVGNEFNAWTISHRVDVPVAPRSPP